MRPTFYLLHKQKNEIKKGQAAVPSAILMCLGCLKPVITSDTDFVWFFDKEVLKYRNDDELKDLIIKVFRNDRMIKRTIEAEKEYVIKHSPKKIASEFLEIFKEELGDEAT